ncbi:FAD-containing oxidoreductase [Silvibacterium dinghuense]|uniref:FAD-containing oxidoreductase n=1 Tax=Silvibacterium dinghuense TaxID=1560006 RepID=A0A4Q1SHY8_9BACT|nr:FAD-containing oxidoreductase [Silvibacterium dinghuense]RXS96800.1 FAD-containing oxidoreductase [Silvibacterium dinghuense]GGG93723.1 mercuric reductase [Silvibacterium dinghuense]
MSTPTHFDDIIIGAGQAGPSLAGRLTQAGRRVAMIERKLFGGTCVNTGCTPTKTLIASAYAAHMVRRAHEYGVDFDAPVRIDFKTLMARKNKVVKNSRHGVEDWLRNMKGCTVYDGHARFLSPNDLQVGTQHLSAERFFLNVGGRAVIPNFPGIREITPLTNVSLLELTELPEHLVIVGGSYVGIEFAQMFRRFGSQVTIVEKAPRLVSHEDEDVSAAILDILEKEGIEVRLNAECIHFQKRPHGAAVGLTCTEGHPEVEGTHVLLAMGRRPNTDDLDLAKAGVKADEHGYVLVDDSLQTSQPHIWAMGDCNGKGAFTHTAYNDFEIVAANLLDKDPRKVSDRLPCYALYTDPPLGRAGMTEAEVRKSGRKALIGTRLMTKVSRALEKGESQGFMKILVDAETKQILGASILGVGGDEAIHSILATMYAKQPYTTMQRAVYIHPTVSELIPTMLGNLEPLK